MTKIIDLGSCDYLVVGSGAASMAFVDTILTELSPANNTKIVMLDQHTSPGGHWNDAYEFVQLHQPSVVYGVSSRQLEGNWLKLLLLHRTLPWKHRATKTELVEYYRDLVNDWVESGKVRYYPECSYDFLSQRQQQANDDDNNNIIHEFKSMDGKQTYRVQVKVKLINGVGGECMVPSKCPLKFPVDDNIEVWTPNQLYDSFLQDEEESSLSWMGRRFLSYFTTTTTTTTNNKTTKITPPKNKKYFVLGCGKTGMDTVVFLQRDMGVSPDNITWIVPNDVWMLNRGGGMGPWSYSQALLSNDGDMDKACLELESKGGLMRLDPNNQPTKMRFPVVGLDELDLMRKVQNVVRRGRVTSIRQDGQNVNVNFGKDHDPLVFQKEEGHLLFIHCTSPGPFNGVEKEEIFVSDKQIDLAMLYAPPVPICMSCIAMLEAARCKGTLNMDFGRKLLVELGRSSGSNVEVSKTLSDNDVLRMLVRPANFASSLYSKTAPFTPLVTSAIFCALIGPQAAVEWLKSNRLSVFSIPGFKGHVYENACKLEEKYKLFGYTESEGKMFTVLAGKLKSLEGM